MSIKNSVLLVIDAQMDFHDVPGANLAVPGSTKDTERTVDFIKNINPSTIFASQDSHYVLDIAHRAWFKDSKGNPIDPFTIVTPDDVRNGKYNPTIDPVRTLNYLDQLLVDGEFKHMVWPDHCIIGTPGHTFHPTFMSGIGDWMRKTLKWVNFIRKGENPFTEHFGIFRSNVPIMEDASTQVNQSIFKTLNDHDTVFLTGQARTHCVANSLKQMLQIAPQLAPKIVVLGDCMSNVAGLPADFYNFVDGIYKDAATKGVSIIKSTDV